MRAIMRRLYPKLRAVIIFVAFILLLFLFISEHSNNVQVYVDRGQSALGRQNFEIVTNGSGINDEQKMVIRNKSDVSLLDSIQNGFTGNESSKISRAYNKGKNGLNSQSVPQFRWCHDHVLDEKIGDDLGCNVLFEGDNGNNSDIYKKRLNEAKEWKTPCRWIENDEQIAKLATADCGLFRETFNFVDKNVGVPVAEEELAFPLAYAMVVEKWAAQVLRVLSAVYRRHNIYCITYDQHASKEFKEAVTAAARCLAPNVIMPEEHLQIYWADISILQATLNCMRLMSEKHHKWKYVQILSYNDFPLRTNLEMVKILLNFDGANDAELSKGQPERYASFHVQVGEDVKKTNKIHPIPPAGILVYKGSYAATLSRQFVRFLFKDKRAQRFLEWSRPTLAPEEQFWSTLIHNDHLNAPGHFPGSCFEYFKLAKTEKKWISRYQVWYDGCQGKFTSGSCVFAVGDLPTLVQRPELVAHKFYADLEPATLYCLAKRHFERTFIKEVDWEFKKMPLDESYYDSLQAVHYQRMEDKEQYNCSVVFEQSR